MFYNAEIYYNNFLNSINNNSLGNGLDYTKEKIAVLNGSIEKIAQHILKKPTAEIENTHKFCISTSKEKYLSYVKIKEHDAPFKYSISSFQIFNYTDVKSGDTSITEEDYKAVLEELPEITLEKSLSLENGKVLKIRDEEFLKPFPIEVRGYLKKIVNRTTIDIIKELLSSKEEVIKQYDYIIKIVKEKFLFTVNLSTEDNNTISISFNVCLDNNQKVAIEEEKQEIQQESQEIEIVKQKSRRFQVKGRTFNYSDEMLLNLAGLRGVDHALSRDLIEKALGKKKTPLKKFEQNLVKFNEKSKRWDWHFKIKDKIFLVVVDFYINNKEKPLYNIITAYYKNPKDLIDLTILE